MNLVIDTHALVWHLADQPARLSRRVRTALNEAERARWTVHVPVVVLLELVLLDERGRIRVAYADLRHQLALRPGFPVEPLDAEDVDEARELASLSDPFDRLIAGTARRLGLPLITNDSAMANVKGLETYW